MAEKKPIHVEPLQLLPAIPGHSHVIGSDGQLTCGCQWPSEEAAKMVAAVVAFNKSKHAARDNSTT